MIINFIVVTKGAGRVSEVNARFTLDAMPGKQMSIDADLNAGVIDQATAQKAPRRVVPRIRLLRCHGRCIQICQRRRHRGHLDFVDQLGRRLGHWRTPTWFVGLSEAGKIYTLLTIGDGLVAQIPCPAVVTGHRHHRDPCDHL